MTLHFEINNPDLESQIAELAIQQNKTVEQQASELLANTLHERETKLQKLREKLAVGAAQADRGEFVNQSLPEILTEFKKERNARQV